MQTYPSRRKYLDIYLIALACAGMALVYIAASRYGPGVSGDSVRYLSVAQNLVAGLGFRDYSLAPLLAWPPMYSIVLAFLALFTGDVFVAGWGLNIALFGLTIYLTGRMIAALAPERLAYAYASAFLVLVLPSLIRLHTIIAADPLFMVLSLSFCLCATQYLRSGRRSALIWMSVLAIFASLVKYPGLVLALMGGLLCVIQYRRSGQFRAGLMAAAGFMAVSMLPLAGWVLVHNYLLNNSLFGVRGYAEPLGNLYIAVEKLLYWFIPYSILQRLSPYGWILLIAAAAVVVVHPASWRRWFERLASAEVLPLSLYAVLYGLTLLFLVSYSEHSDIRVDRLHIAMIFPVLAFLVSALETLRLRWKNPLPASLTGIMLLLAFLAWTLYPINNTRKYVTRSLAQGETDNNLYNTRALRESDVVTYLEAHPFAPGEVLYGNHEGAVWFYTRHNVLGMPQGDRANEENPDLPEIFETYKDWPPQPGYIVWFDLGFKLHILHPKDLSPLALISPVFEGELGGIYQVTP